MPDKPVFLDTNMWVYLFTDTHGAENRRKQDIVRQVLSNRSNIVVSTQVLNEASNVWLKKYGLDIDRVKSYLKTIRKSAEVHLLNEALTFRALDLFDRYKLSFYDSLIIAAALDAGCRTFYVSGKAKILGNRCVHLDPPRFGLGAKR